MNYYTYKRFVCAVMYCWIHSSEMRSCPLTTTFHELLFIKAFNKSCYYKHKVSELCFSLDQVLVKSLSFDGCWTVPEH